MNLYGQVRESFDDDDDDDDGCKLIRVKIIVLCGCNRL
jgi:hypothetical protein